MANPTVAAETCVALGATGHQFESFPGRDIALGALTVTRVLPVKGKRLVGPWCFLDRFGPLTFQNPSPMDIGAHPHIGLQTVTWLFDGELVHYDSLGSESLLRPGAADPARWAGARRRRALEGRAAWLRAPGGRGARPGARGPRGGAPARGGGAAGRRAGRPAARRPPPPTDAAPHPPNPPSMT